MHDAADDTRNKYCIFLFSTFKTQRDGQAHPSTQRTRAHIFLFSTFKTRCKREHTAHTAHTAHATTSSHNPQPEEPSVTVAFRLQSDEKRDFGGSSGLVGLNASRGYVCVSVCRTRRGTWGTWHVGFQLLGRLLGMLLGGLMGDYFMCC